MNIQPQRVIVNLTRPDCSASAGALQVRLNSRPVSLAELPAALRSTLSWHAVPLVFLEGGRCLEMGEVVRVMDTIRGAWFGVRIVLLRQALKGVSDR